MSNASRDSLEAHLRVQGEQVHQALEQAAGAPAPGALVSSTDPEAPLARKNGQTTLEYKDHQVVDDRCGVITATVTTDAGAPEAEVLAEVLDQHQENTHQAGQDRAQGFPRSVDAPFPG